MAFAAVNFDLPAGSGASFGGQIASPMQFNPGPHGTFESQPHDVVHVALGGLMSDPDTAAQDPIFWLHHANIDRMWNRWLAPGGVRMDASDAAWLNTRFTFYDEAGHAVYLTGADIENTVGQLNDRYDDDPAVGHKAAPRAQSLVAGRAAVAGAVAPQAAQQNLTTTVAAQRVDLAGKTERLQLPLAQEASTRMRALAANNAQHHAFLRLDDIRYDKSSGVHYDIFINLPEGAKLDIHTPGYAGNLSLFGLKPHAMAGHPPAAATNIFVESDISHLIGNVVAGNPKNLTVVLVPRGLFDANGEPLPVAEETQGSIGSARIVGR